MNQMFLKLTGEIVALAAVGSCALGAVLTHIAYATAKCRKDSSVQYLPFMLKWLLRRALPCALLFSLIVAMLVTIPAVALGWYRTYWFQRMSDQRLVLRIHDLESIPMDSGVSRLFFNARHSTTNSKEIAELIDAIRFSPTYPNCGCLCMGGSRKFELSSVSRYGVEDPVATFTVPHDQSIRFWHDWYGDWALSSSSQAKLAAWQKRYVDNTPVATNLIDAIPAGQTDYRPTPNMTYRLSASDLHSGDTTSPTGARASITRLVAREFVFRTHLRERFTVDPSSVTNSHSLHRAQDNGDELHVIVSLSDSHIAARYFIRTEQWLAAEQKRIADEALTKGRRARRGTRRRRRAPEERVEPPAAQVQSEGAPSD
jgi:hypothetical protein